MDGCEKITMYKLRKKAGYLERSIMKKLPESKERQELIDKIHALCLEIGAAIEAKGISMIERD